MAVLYFILFCVFVYICGITARSNALLFILSLLFAEIFLIVFISGWEDIFDDEE